MGNVAGDSPALRDVVLKYDALLPLLLQLNEHAKLSMLRNATWTLSNFCRGKPQPNFEQVCFSSLTSSIYVFNTSEMCEHFTCNKKRLLIRCHCFILYKIFKPVLFP